MKKKRRAIDIFSLSFLDVVSCGFGAIILLLVISKISEPLVSERITTDLSSRIVELHEQITSLKEQVIPLRQDLERARLRLSAGQEQEAALRIELRAVDDKIHTIEVDSTAQAAIEKQLQTARQTLTDEMRRLQQKRPPSFAPDAIIGGVPVDSEYIIFIIDTSGSMQRYAWPLVRTKMKEILDIYPGVKGIQVMNDMGDYMFSQYAGEWIPDTPARRRAILRRLSSWSPFSNSSPVEGVMRAIKRFYAADKRISLYILGDDFSRGSIQAVVDTINSINKAVDQGSRRVRIHAVGFPVLFTQAGYDMNVARFAALMRRLAEDNNGSFVGLTGLR